jgi:hypothetical protein
VTYLATVAATGCRIANRELINSLAFGAEETGVSRAWAVPVVERIARKHGIVDKWWIAWRTGMVIVAAATISNLCFLLVAAL